MNELNRRTGQIATSPDQLTPEVLGLGLERHRPESVAHLPQQHWQMRGKTPPVNLDQLAPALYFRAGELLVETRGDGRGVDRSIRLRKLRQAAHADTAMPAEETPDENPQDHGSGGADIAPIISQSLQ